MVFEDYAKYYDLLYSDKNYKAECGYVSSLIQLYAPDAHKILEFDLLESMATCSLKPVL